MTEVKTISAYKTKEQKPIVSNKFDVPSVLYKRVYYFLKDLKKSTAFADKPFEIQVVSYCGGKYRQDTHYITNELLKIITT